MINNGEWNDLLMRTKVKEGDFFYIPSGSIHAIGKGIVIIETQQSSDLTYRLYDYDRKDALGQQRELHWEKAIKASIIPHKISPLNQIEETKVDLTVKRLVQNRYFTVYHWKLKGRTIQKMVQDFLQISVIKGTAKVTVENKSFIINKGCHFLLPNGIEKYELLGDAEFIVSWTS